MIVNTVLSKMRLGLFRQFDPYKRVEYFTTIRNNRRFTHTYVNGKTGVGKSTALINWALQDIIGGEGLAFFDVHGDAIEEILYYIPPRKRKDVIIYNPADQEFPIGFNILDNISKDNRPFVASSVVDAFKSIWSHSWGVQLEQFLYNSVAALLDTPHSTLMGIKYLLTSPAYRERVLRYVQDPVIKDFWQSDFEEHMPKKEQRQRTLSTLNKIGALISDPAIRNSIGQSKTSFNLQDIMDNRKILLILLPQGKLGIEKASLIGSLILSHIHLTAMQRKRRTPFHLYIDECHHFQTVTEMLSGIRKFNVSLVLSHQYLDQLTPEFRAAVLGTVGTLVSFRLGGNDAEALQKEFELTRNDIEFPQLPPFTAYVRSDNQTLLLDMPPVTFKEYPSSPAKILANCRQKYATPRKFVERRIQKFIENA